MRYTVKVVWTYNQPYEIMLDFFFISLVMQCKKWHWVLEKESQDPGDSPSSS